MRKVLIVILSLIFTINIANAKGGTLKNFNAYVVNGHNIREVSVKMQEEINHYADIHTHKVDGVEYTWCYTNPNDNETFYLRLYPANKDTNIYIVGNAQYDKNDNDVTKFCKSKNYTYEKLSDKDALKEYKFDFYDVVRKNSLGTFFITPDCVKPLKSCMKNLNNWMAKHSKSNAAIPFSVDTDEIDLTKIDTVSCNDTEANVGITVNEYRLKQKENKYVHAFEYLVKNNANSTLELKTVNCERLASTKDITTETFIDLDRLDLLDNIGSFPPVLICTCGTSIVLSIPNWVRLARTTKEATRYAKELPSNYAIQPNKTLRILVMKYKTNKKPLNFTFERDGVTYNLSF